MSNPKISVIIPIYNVDDYLEGTLDCLVNQTFLDNMEILMIDDGSTDNSRYIIEKYALDYDNFYAFHKKNEGAPIARNFGLERARGEYVHFLDSDDNLKDTYGYEKLYEIATKYDSDIVTVPLIRFRRYNVFDGQFYEHSFKKIEESVFSTKFQNHPELIWDLFITNKIYKLDFLKKNNLKHIDTNKAYCDDAPFSLKAYLLSDNISIFKDIFYYWRVRTDGNTSLTQKMSDSKAFFDRLDAVDMCLNVVGHYGLNSSMSKEFYLKFLNYDLYIHLSKFYNYDAEYYPEFIRRAKTILSQIPEEYKQDLNSTNKIIYAMIEEEDIEGLVNFTSIESELRQNPHIPEDLNKKYVELLDFNHDVRNEKLIARREDIYLDGNNLIITYTKRINYLSNDYSHKTVFKLVDDGAEFTLNEKDSKITIPIDLLKDMTHAKIKIKCIFDSFKKEGYLKNNRRDIIELDNIDIEIGIAVNNLLVLDIRPTNDLIVEIEDVQFEDNLFKFSGSAKNEISDVYIQNVITFDKIFYDVESVKNDENYEISFSIPYNDILSHPVSKWELRVGNTFKIIKLNKKTEFYDYNDFIYIINMRNKILISFDFYNIYEKLDKLKNQTDTLKSRNSKLREKNTKLSEKNAKLLERNAKLSQKNKKLKETVDEYKSRKVIKFVDKIKK